MGERGAELRVMFRGVGVAPGWPEEVERAQRKATISVGGVPVPRIRYGSEGRPWLPAREPCGDCVAIRGEFHVPGCDLERCPACGGQALGCGCADEDPAAA